MQVSSVGAGKPDLGVAPNVRQVGEGEGRPAGTKSEETRGERHRTPEKTGGNQVDELEVIRAIEHANRALEGVYTQFEFSIHEKTREIMVKVIDRDSGEVIREIPPEQILDMVAKMWELAGILVDERV